MANVGVGLADADACNSGNCEYRDGWINPKVFVGAVGFCGFACAFMVF